MNEKSDLLCNAIKEIGFSGILKMAGRTYEPYENIAYKEGDTIKIIKDKEAIEDVK